MSETTIPETPEAETSETKTPAPEQTEGENTGTENTEGEKTEATPPGEDNSEADAAASEKAKPMGPPPEPVPGYETIFILHPETGEEDQEGLIEKYKALIGANGGQVIHHTTWGRRKLAYEVKKNLFGFYHLFYMDKTPDALRALENSFRIEDPVIKWMSVSVEDVEKEFADFEKLKNEGSAAQTLSE